MAETSSMESVDNTDKIKRSNNSEKPTKAEVVAISVGRVPGYRLEIKNTAIDEKELLHAIDLQNKLREAGVVARIFQTSESLRIEGILLEEDQLTYLKGLKSREIEDGRIANLFFSLPSLGDTQNISVYKSPDSTEYSEGGTGIFALSRIPETHDQEDYVYFLVSPSLVTPEEAGFIAQRGEFVKGKKESKLIKTKLDKTLFEWPKSDVVRQLRKENYVIFSPDNKDQIRKITFNPNTMWVYKPDINGITKKVVGSVTTEQRREITGGNFELMNVIKDIAVFGGNAYWMELGSDSVRIIKNTDKDQGWDYLGAGMEAYGSEKGMLSEEGVVISNEITAYAIGRRIIATIPPIDDSQLKPGREFSPRFTGAKKIAAK